MSKAVDNARIRELEAEVERLRTLVHHDPLTGALNRRGFKEQADLFFRAIQYTREHPDQRRSVTIEAFSFLFIDIDNFKKLNDEQGHKAGDQALKEVVEAIEQNIRHSDVIGRWGGEEIVVGLAGASEEEAYRLADKIRKDIKERAAVTVSIGVAELANEEITLDGLIARADKAMYVAKHERGKNTVVNYSELS